MAGNNGGGAEPPLLTIVTRSCKRPTCLAKLKASIAAQTDQGIEHYIIEDEVGRGIGWSHREIARRAPEYRGQYVQVIDDDDWIVTPEYVADLRRIIQRFLPDVLVVRMREPSGSVLPLPESWGSMPHVGRMAGENAVVRRDLFVKHADAWSERYEGDFDFLAALWVDAERVYWHDAIVLTTDVRRRGQVGE